MAQQMMPREITDIAVERKQTLLAFESMHSWTTGAVRDVHLFYRNNEMAGYCAVQHAFGLYGIDGHYGPPRSAVVLSLGSVSRGAICALLGRGSRTSPCTPRAHPSWFGIGCTAAPTVRWFETSTSVCGPSRRTARAVQ